MSRSIKKKLVALMIVGALAIPTLSFAKEKQETLISEHVTEEVILDEQAEVQENYIRYVGVIKEVRDNNGRISILATNEDDETGIIFHISDKVSLWSLDTEQTAEVTQLKKGEEVVVYYHKNTPMALSIPGQLTPAVIVIQDKEDYRATHMDVFNEELVSADNFLKLNIGEETVIVNEAGEELTQQDIYNQTALVFFGPATKSIPAQTVPSKVVVFKAVGETEEVVQESAGIEEGVVMTPLRSTVAELGYEVQWNDDKSIELTKQNQTIVIQIGKLDYTLNKSLGKFSKAPELQKGITYVSTEILEIMN